MLAALHRPELQTTGAANWVCEMIEETPAGSVLSVLEVGVAAECVSCSKEVVVVADVARGDPRQSIARSSLLDVVHGTGQRHPRRVDRVRAALERRHHRVANDHRRLIRPRRRSYHRRSDGCCVCGMTASEIRAIASASLKGAAGIVGIKARGVRHLSIFLGLKEQAYHFATQKKRQHDERQRR